MYLQHQMYLQASKSEEKKTEKGDITHHHVVSNVNVMVSNITFL